MISVRDLIWVLRFSLQEVSDWISLARASHLDYGAVAEVSLYLAGGSCEVSHSSIHPSAWNRNSANFSLTEFYEVRLTWHLRNSRPTYVSCLRSITMPGCDRKGLGRCQRNLEQLSRESSPGSRTHYRTFPERNAYTCWARAL